MSRCFLKGLTPDAINAVLAATGSNLQKLLRLFFPALILWASLVLKNGTAPQRHRRGGQYKQPQKKPVVKEAIDQAGATLA